ncbi:tyrosine-type recombinase/integrase [Enterococcus faecalis]|uniref:tyrosine-type recombinase/integrase n=1 Tax=Enterococcus faecalis TaxID=1351 RepID=UPI0035CC30B9
MKLRANIVEKRGTLHVVVTYKDEIGKPRQKWRDTKLKKKGNKKRAEKIKEDFLKEVEEQLGQTTPSKKVDSLLDNRKDLLFYDYLVEYLDVVEKEVSFSTFIGYKKYVEKRIKTFFEPSKLLLTDLRPAHLQKYYQQILDDGCTTNTVIHYHAFLRKALQNALINELCDVNIADRVKRPRKNHFMQKFYNSEEVLELIRAAQGEKIRLVIILTAFYGLRRSEVLGLKWQAIDFVNKKITINHVVTDNPEDNSNPLRLDRTKNSTSYRTLPLVESIEKELVAWAKWQQSNRKYYGKEYYEDDNEYLFTMEDGHLMKPGYLTHRLTKIMKKNNLRVIRFHDLRHSNASILLANGQDMKKIQEWLGHASYTTTANLYTHLSADFKNEAASSLEASLKI